MSAELAPVTQFPSPHVRQPRNDAPHMVITLEDNANHTEDLKRFVNEQMIKGTDYGPMPGGGKCTLFKPGAERLLAVYGLSTRTDVIHRVEDWDKNFVAYEVKVTVINKRTGLIEAEDVGSCNSKESRYKNRPAADVANTILKMAKKRALVTATMLATRTSSMFQSEDFQDDEGTAPRQNNNRNQNSQRNENRTVQNRTSESRRETAQAVVDADKPASRELVANTERLRRLAVAEGFTANNDAHLKPIPHSFTNSQCETRLKQLREWLKKNAAEALDGLKGTGKFAPGRDAKYSKCKSCGWPITFVQSSKGMNMPVDADGVPHFIMCTRPEAHRKAPERKPTPRPNQAPASTGLPKHISHLWAVISNSALPPSKQGKYRNERIDAANTVLYDHQLPTVESFNDLDEQQAGVLCGAIDAGILCASPEGFWTVNS